MTDIRLLLLDDCPDDLELAAVAATKAAGRAGVELTFHSVRTWRDAKMQLGTGLDVAVVDLGLLDADGRDVAKHLEDHGVKTVIWTGAPTAFSDVDKGAGIDVLSDRLEPIFESVVRSRTTDPDLPSVQAPGVLVVEDDDVDWKLLKKRLADTGHEVTIRRVVSAEEAVRVLSGGFRPILVIVDEALPGMSGGTLLRVMRQHPDWGEPTIFRYSGDETVTGKLIHKPPSAQEVEFAVTVAKVAAMITTWAAMMVT